MKFVHKLTILAVVLIVAAISGLLLFKEGTLPVNKTEPKEGLFVIAPGQSPNSIITQLHKEGYIRNRIAFYLVVRQMGIETNIQAGDFRLSSAMSASEVAEALTKGSVDEWVTIIEGLRKEEIAQVLSQEIGIPEVEFNELGREGYLFPDTYLVPKEATAQTIIDIMSANFEAKYTEELASKARALGLTQHEFITMASIVEKEGRGQDREVVADVLMRRYKEGHPLQADATVQYALGYQASEQTWWKRPLTFDDLKLESPFSTYANNGLPPTPISNPGISSMEAVAGADPSTPYFYYLHEPDGTIHPSRTLKEHGEKIEKYLN